MILCLYGLIAPKLRKGEKKKFCGCSTTLQEKKVTYWMWNGQRERQKMEKQKITFLWLLSKHPWSETIKISFPNNQWNYEIKISEIGFVWYLTLWEKNWI